MDVLRNSKPLHWSLAINGIMEFLFTLMAGYWVLSVISLTGDQSH
jgi:hypothetical protein